MYINFGKETRNALNHYGFIIDDISWIGTRKFKVPIDEFFRRANNTAYDNGYGIVAIPLDLLIVMKDGSYFERREYDGSEWWQYIDVLKEPQITFNFKSTVILFNNNNTEDLIDYVDTTIGGNNGVPAMQN